MSRFSPPKHLLFYVVVMGVVLVLFQVVSTYGESNLKAPPNIDGRYLSAAAPPGCPDTERLVLTIQQSGIYLNGSMNLEQASTLQNASGAESPSEEKPSMTGLWQPTQITLAGKTHALSSCTASQQGNSAPHPAAGVPVSVVTVQGQVSSAPKAVFTGQLSLEGSAQPWQFTAERQAVVKAKPGH
ncbi:MAG TPA: hypothetical protein V6C57_20730 [Coleofasciculaceae cyanobacterium]